MIGQAFWDIRSMIWLVFAGLSFWQSIEATGDDVWEWFGIGVLCVLLSFLAGYIAWLSSDSASEEGS